MRGKLRWESVCAYESSLLGDSHTENNVNTQTPTISDNVETTPKPAGGEDTSNLFSVVDSLVSDINSDEKTCPAIPGKLANALDSILANGVNEQVLSKTKKEALIAQGFLCPRELQEAMKLLSLSHITERLAP